jgi:acetolactate synthase-1/2/3 large subunit
MSRSGGELVARALEDEGITHAFGIPGTHNLELYDALAASRVTPVLVTDEQSAGFMADGYWRASGRIACVNLVPGAGLTHALSGIAEAYLDGVPMLVLSCGIRRDVRMAYQLHDVDQLAIAAPVTKAQFRPMTGAELYGAVRTACAVARAGTPGPVMVEVPVNLYLTRHDVSPHDLTSPVPIPPPNPDPGDLDRAAGWLAEPGARPLLYLGAGARGAGRELVALAERLGGPVATTIQGKGVFPESHPLFLWNGFGNAAPSFVREITSHCDRILAIGCRFSEVGTAGYGVTLPGPLLHVDINPEVLGRNFPAHLAIAADATAFVRGVLERLGTATTPLDPALTARIAEGHAAVRARWQADPSRDRVTPYRLFTALQHRLGRDTVFVTDSGNGTFLAMEMLRLNQPGKFLAPVDYSCMGYSVPAAIGAAIARPDLPVVALAGDGAFLMTGLELLTPAAREIPLAVVVLRDRQLAQIAQFQHTAFSRRVASALPDYDLPSLARGLGLDCLALPDDASLDTVLAALERVLAERRPVLVEAAVDYSRKTYFTRGVVRTMLNRLPWRERLRFVARAIARRVITE